VNKDLYIYIRLQMVVGNR